VVVKDSASVSISAPACLCDEPALFVTNLYALTILGYKLGSPAIRRKLFSELPNNQPEVIKMNLFRKFLAHIERGEPLSEEIINPPPVILLASGPTASGKNVLAQWVKTQRGIFGDCRSTTTRQPRSNRGVMEQNGVEYDFVHRDTFLHMINQGLFMEHAEVHGELYGKPWASMLEPLSRGQSVIGDIDVQGMGAILRLDNPLLKDRLATIFIAPPSITAMQVRLRGRTENITPEEEGRRIQTAVKEIPQAPRYDHVIVNDHLDVAKRQYLEFVDFLTLPMCIRKRLALFKQLREQRAKAISFLEREFDWQQSPRWAVKEGPTPLA
jgi:guanylate kinase